MRQASPTDCTDCADCTVSAAIPQPTSLQAAQLGKAALNVVQSGVQAVAKKGEEVVGTVMDVAETAATLLSGQPVALGGEQVGY